MHYDVQINYLFDVSNYSLEEWQTASGNDANSLSVDPLFVGADDAIPDLHITAASPMIDMGTPVYPLVVDVDDDIRDQQPDIGCDEFYTGSILVGTGETYESLKDAFDAINAGTVTGNISINLTSGTTETATATLYQSGYNGTSDYTSVSIGTTNDDVTVSGNIDEPIVSFNGAHDVNMVNLTIENENSGGYCIQFTNSASNNRIAGCSFLGVSQLANKGLVTFDVAGSGSGNNNNTIENSNFGNGASNYRYGMVSTGTTSVGNNDNTVTESKIYNFWSNTNSSTGIYLDEYNANWDISDNHLYQTETITATGGNAHYGIQSLSTNNINISNNYIGGTSEECGGTAWTVDGTEPNTFTGILISGENTGESTINDNTISDFSWTAAPIDDMYEGTGLWTGIGYGGGILTISDNTIGATTGNDNIVIETTSGFHVASYGIKGGIDGTNVTISGNEIGGIDVACSSVDYSHIFVGIQNDGATEVSISNNIINNLKASTECTHTETGQHVAGIINNANTTNCSIDNNTIDDLYNATKSDWSSDSGSPFGHTVLGIAVTDGVNTIASNTIRALSTSSIDDRTEAVRGISVASNKHEQIISDNIISSLSTTNNSDNSKLVGIYYHGPTTGTNKISSNQVFKITSAEYDGLASVIKGIHIEDGVATDFVNNVISLGYDQTAGHEIIGIYTSKNGTFYHNSVNIDGDVSGSLNANTYAFRINQDVSTAAVKNNIFVNTRTNSGTGKNYAALCQGNIELDYNAYWVDGTGTVLGNDGTDDKTNLPIVAGQDAHSVNDEITFTSPDDADLSTTTATVNAAADASVGVTTDYEGNTRNPSYPDMGAYEFTQPIIIDPGANLDFGWSDVLTPTAPQSYQIVGIDLSNKLVVTAPEHFQVSLSEDEGFAQSISIARTNSNVDTTIYARFMPDYLPDVGNLHYGDITNSATGQEVTVHVQGSARVIEPIVETGLATDLTTESATANAEVLHTGGQTVTRRGIIHWPYDGSDREIDGTGVVNVQETGSFETGDFSMLIEGLDANTHYNFRAHAYNGETGYGETADFWTLAEVPDAPIVSNITSDTIDIAINENMNPAHTVFAIHETTTNRYIQTDGTMNTSPVWQTRTDWGTATVTLYDLNNRTGNREYVFQVKARNGDNVETDYSDSETILTLANIPNVMWVGNITKTSVDISVYTSSGDYSNNSATTQYAITEHNSGLFVQTDGTLGNAAAWKTRDEWVYFTVTGLNNGTEYSFSSIAKNDDGIETDPGPEVTTYTLAAVPGAPLLNNISSTTANLEIDPGENTGQVEYAIQATRSPTNKPYVQADGSLGSDAVWKTATEWNEKVINGMTPNETISFAVKARNENNIETAHGESVEIITLAKTPNPPNVDVNSYTDMLYFNIDGSGNSDITEFVIQDSASGLFVQDDGYLGDAPVWKTKNNWILATHYVRGLMPSSRYQIRVKARNTDDIETEWSEPAERVTMAETPGAPTISNATASSLDVEIDPADNPSGVTFLLHDQSTGKYVQADGTFGSEEVWRSAAEWGVITITGLNPDYAIALRVKARNLDEVETSFSQSENSHTLANVPVAPSVEVKSSTTIEIAVQDDGNPGSVRYAIIETTTDQYVGYNGEFSETPIWFDLAYYATVDLRYLTPDTEYTFRVIARNSDGVETEPGPAASGTTPSAPPAAPTLAEPANYATGQEVSLTLAWNEVEKANSYGVQVSSSSWFGDDVYIVFDTNGLEDLSILVDNLIYGYTYYWRVNASNADGEGDWSDSWSFTTKAGPPAIPELKSPGNGEENVQTIVHLNWDDSHGAETYTVQVSTESDFSILLIDDYINNNVWLELSDLDGLTTYYWRVKASNSHGESAWSEAWSFTTTLGLPDAPVLAEPVNGATDVPSTVGLTWHPVEYAENYEIQIGHDSDMSGFYYWNDNVGDTTVIYSDLTHNTVYYWWVRAKNQSGTGEWSEIWSFTIGNPTGIFESDDENNESYQLYPKPVDDILNISGIDAFPVRIKIISGSGQILDDKFIGEGLVNVQHLMPGMYYLMIETSGESVIRRFIKR